MKNCKILLDFIAHCEEYSFFYDNGEVKNLLWIKGVLIKFDENIGAWNVFSSKNMINSIKNKKGLRKR